MESMGQWDNEKHDIIVPRDVVFDEQPILDGAITILEEEPRARRNCRTTSSTTGTTKVAYSGRIREGRKNVDSVDSTSRTNTKTSHIGTVNQRETEEVFPRGIHEAKGKTYCQTQQDTIFR